MNARDKIIRILIPKLMESHPDGIITRKELLDEFVTLGVPSNQPWLIATKAGHGRYDISTFYEEADALGEAEMGVTEDTRTDSEVESLINEKFGAIERMAKGVVSGKFCSMILSGNPGIGKTYSLEEIFTKAQEANPTKISYRKITGFVRATGLFHLLWDNREAGQIVLLDDSDSVFADEVALNLLKAATDGTVHQRRVAWLAERSMIDEMEEDIPKDFAFNGQVVFITNLDFDKLCKGNSKLTPHLTALMSRSYYVDMNLRSERELLSRIDFVIHNTEMLKAFTLEEREFLVRYIHNNVESLRELSLRMVVKLGQLYKSADGVADFEKMARVSCHRTKG